MEPWMDNEISFPSVLGCQLVDSPIILKALIEGFQAKFSESRVPLVGFSGEVNYSMGVVDLNVTIGELDRLQTVTMEFAVVKCHSPYNVILGRIGMRSLGVVASTIHSMIKFPMANGIATMKRRETQEEQRLEAGQLDGAAGKKSHPE
ncbi:hypothetical protein Tco_0059774 [Tanacetum coccineum]